MKSLLFSSLSLALCTIATARSQPSDHLVFEAQGKSCGKHVVLLAGDEEYRSEEAMPLLGQILATQGFKATVLFSLDADGTVNPDAGSNLSHSESLDTADAIVMSLRFRHWDDSSMRRFDNALNRGVPIVALRTSTHAFNFPADSIWAKYSYNAKADTGWEKGFGRQVLGETWVNHHGKHKVEGTRSVVETTNSKHPILNGVGTIFGTTDVYGASPLDPSTILLRGAVTKSLDPASPAIKGKKNDPMMPIAWTRKFNNAGEKPNRILTTTMGAATDLSNENLRRLVVNGVYWGLEMKVPAKADVSLPGKWSPSKYSFRTYKKGLMPSNFIVK